MCSIICFFMIIQPGMLYTSALFVSCEDIGDNSYNIADSNLKCTDDYYQNTVLPVNITILLIVGLCFPVYVLYTLW